MSVYYNEFDPKAAAWLRELIKEGLIAPGEVDTRSIRDVQPADLGGYTQCHFFAGIGGWSYALRLAGWPDDKPVWTGSCPCQPFSCAGKGLGTADDRHLWPVFANLIRECRPATVFGEQVASSAGRGWLSGVFADLEAMAYTRTGADLCAAGVGAPHIRQRLYWVAHTTVPRFAPAGLGPELREQRRGEWLSGAGQSAGGGGGMGNTTKPGHERTQSKLLPTGQAEGRLPARPNDSGRVEYSALSEEERQRFQPEHLSGQTTGFWSSAIWHPCRDGKVRRISPKPEIFPLAHGLPGRVGLLRGAGNAIVPQVAAVFIEAVQSILGDA